MNEKKLYIKKYIPCKICKGKGYLPAEHAYSLGIKEILITKGTCRCMTCRCMSEGCEYGYKPIFVKELDLSEIKAFGKKL